MEFKIQQELDVLLTITEVIANFGYGTSDIEHSLNIFAVTAPSDKFQK